jgi:hypothetical protein
MVAVHRGVDDHLPEQSTLRKLLPRGELALRWDPVILRETKATPFIRLCHGDEANLIRVPEGVRPIREVPSVPGPDHHSLDWRRHHLSPDYALGREP